MVAQRVAAKMEAELPSSYFSTVESNEEKNKEVKSTESLGPFSKT